MPRRSTVTTNGQAGSAPQPKVSTFTGKGAKASADAYAAMVDARGDRNVKVTHTKTPKK